MLIIVYCVLRFRSRLTDSFGVHSTVKPVMYSGRGRPPKRALLNAGIPNEVSGYTVYALYHSRSAV